ncbi:MarR family winged helix-turn-helix transcriptional regulator [Tenggerimyces flavus]|uniref:MarR family winged helix-turn-helix transcriptional regulator n=1 Tax=Tenggerimyces flavus TaxID=1708749 RepID=A0ABV7Y6P1_9ACTN|nr:MarR family transcriptional regulator [Tenggerimyces flavus]MBM7791128.1 DNA-binding MarR family transcriptional regulator [Tenggerimyces flavus]
MTRQGGDEVDELVAAWQRELPELATAELELAKRAAKLSAILGGASKDVISDHGLTWAEFDVLATLRRSGPPYQLRPSALTRSLLFTSGGISNVLQRLEAAGLVERGEDSSDARSRWVQLTMKGQQEAEAVLRASAEAQDDVLMEVPPSVLRSAADALREVLLALRPPPRPR